MRRFTSQHVELMTKRQDLCLQRRSRPEQSDQRQANQPVNISHQPRASPDSTSLASRIEFPTMTSEILMEQWLYYFRFWPTLAAVGRRVEPARPVFVRAGPLADLGVSCRLFMAGTVSFSDASSTA